MAVANYIDRIKIWYETKAVAERIAASVPPSEKLTLEMVPRCTGYERTQLTIDDIDCIDVGITLHAEGLNPVILTMADDSDAGGCIDLGSGAQEESLWRRTALCVTQLQSFYPLVGAEAIYSPAVPVLRHSEAEGYTWYAEGDRPVLNFIACPAIKMPRWVASSEEPSGDLTDRDKMLLSRKLRLILRIAAAKGHDAVVLGAMGCGAWGNPPRAVARVFAAVLSEFDGVFKKIVIAILSTGRPTILRAFTSVFDSVFG